MADLTHLRDLYRNWTYQVQKMRRDAEILTEKASILELKCVDLDIALSRLEDTQGDKG